MTLGETNESIWKAITSDLALSVSPCVGAKISLRDPSGPSGGRGFRVCSGIFRAVDIAEVVKLNIQADHVHLFVGISPKVSVTNYDGKKKGGTATRVFNELRELKTRHYWDNQFWGADDAQTPLC